VVFNLGSFECQMQRIRVIIVCNSAFKGCFLFREYKEYINCSKRFSGY